MSWVLILINQTEPEPVVDAMLQRCPPISEKRRFSVSCASSDQHNSVSKIVLHTSDQTRAFNPIVRTGRRLKRSLYETCLLHVGTGGIARQYRTSWIVDSTDAKAVVGLPAIPNDGGLPETSLFASRFVPDGSSSFIDLDAFHSQYAPCSSPAQARLSVSRSIARWPPVSPSRLR